MRKIMWKTALGILILGMSVSLFAAEIHDAVRSGDLAKVRALIDKDAGLVNLKDENGRTPLHWAARGTNNEVLAYLVEKGAELNLLDNAGTAPLHALAFRGNIEGARLLLDKGADVNVLTANKSTPLHIAAQAKKADILKLFKEYKADLEIKNDYGRTPLVIAAREMAGPAVVRVLLELGANVDATDKYGDTALTLAAWRGSADVVDLLLEKNAALPAPNTRQARMVLDSAVSTGLAGLFSRLVEKGVDLPVDSDGGRTLLHSAAEGGSVPILKILVEKGLDVNRRDAFGWTPLHFAVDMGRTAALEYLLSKGAEATHRTTMGQSLTNLAEDNEDKEMLALLEAKGFDRSPARFPELKGEYLGQKKPGRKAEIFAPGIVSARYGLHSSIVFSPDGRTAFWSIMIPARTAAYGGGRLVVSRLVDGKWTYPKKAVYGGVELDDVPFFHPDGTRLYDMARRAFPGGRDTGKENIWMWDKAGEGWANPRPLDAVINDLPQHWQFSVDREGNVYFCTTIPGGLGGNDIYVSRWAGGRYQKPENLGPAINSPAGEDFPFIAPDGRYLLFGRAMDLYVSFRQKDGSWSEARPLGPEVNSRDMEVLPFVSPDGKSLFFNRGWGSFWIDASVIEDAAPKDRK